VGECVGGRAGGGGEGHRRGRGGVWDVRRGGVIKGDGVRDGEGRGGIGGGGEGERGGGDEMRGGGVEG